MEWARCPQCGREVPLTMFRRDGITGRRREVCEKCHHQSVEAARDRPRKGTKARPWLREDLDVLYASEGRDIRDVAMQLGRSENATHNMLPVVGMRTRNRIIERMDPASGKG